MALGPEFDPGNVCLDTLWVAERIGEAGVHGGSFSVAPHASKAPKQDGGCPGVFVGWGRGAEGPSWPMGLASPCS